jgi:hypothetical protein
VNTIQLLPIDEAETDPHARLQRRGLFLARLVIRRL